MTFLNFTFWVFFSDKLDSSIHQAAKKAAKKGTS